MDLRLGLGDDRAVASGALRIVQGLPYRADPPGSSDLVTAACETLTIGGDCEDLAALLVALWSAAGLGGRIVWLSQDGASQDHVSAQVWVSGAWWWGEPTVPGARLGEYPYLAAARLGVGSHGAL